MGFGNSLTNYNDFRYLKCTVFTEFKVKLILTTFISSILCKICNFTNHSLLWYINTECKWWSPSNLKCWMYKMYIFGKDLSSATHICRYDFYIDNDSDATKDFINIIYHIFMNFTIKYLKIATGKIIQISHKATLMYGLYIQHFKFEVLHH